MKIGAPREIFEGENRVAMTPDSVLALAKLDHSAVIEAGAGAKAGFTDAAYEAAGAEVVKDAKAVFAAADVVVKVRGPEAAEAALLKVCGLRVRASLNQHCACKSTQDDASSRRWWGHIAKRL